MITTTCSYTNPREADGTVPTMPNRSFQYASSTCKTEVASTTVPVYLTRFASSSQDNAGPNLNEWLFVVAVIIFFLSWIAWPRISFTKE